MTSYRGKIQQGLQKGFVGRILLIAVAIFLAASYFNVDLKSAVEGFTRSEVTKNNYAYLKSVGMTVWKSYLEEPSQYFWNNVLSGLIKDSINQNINNLKALKEGNYEALKLTPVVPQGLIPNVPSTAIESWNYEPGY